MIELFVVRQNWNIDPLFRFTHEAVFETSNEDEVCERAGDKSFNSMIYEEELYSDLYFEDITLNQFQTILILYLSICNQLEFTRIFSCRLEIIDSYLKAWKEKYMLGDPKQFCFVVDEIMMLPSKLLKLLVTRNIEHRPSDSAHITAFCVNNRYAIQLQSTNIVSKLKRKLKTFAKSWMIHLSFSLSA